MAQKLAMVVDASVCIDCKGCMASCKVANQVPDDNWRNWIKSPGAKKGIKSGKRIVFQPGGCMQCENPTCVTACPTGATYKDKNTGVVVIDRSLCIGCGQCLPACPYGARYRHPQLKVADKCDFCAQRRAAGLEPACVSTCPTKARAFGDLNDPKSEVSRLMAQNKGRVSQVVNAATNTNPNMYYLGDPGMKDWPVEARMPTPFNLWRYLAGPAVAAFTGLTALGVLAMLGKQIMMKNDHPEGEDRHE